MSPHAAPDEGPTGENDGSRRSRQPRELLFAVVALVGVLVLVGGGIVASASSGPDGGSNRAKVDARSIHAVAEKWLADHPGRCPTMQILRAEKELAPTSKLTDPWDTTYAIRCDGDDVTVVSFGPDKKEATVDDIVVPESKGQR